MKRVDNESEGYVWKELIMEVKAMYEKELLMEVNAMYRKGW